MAADGSSNLTSAQSDINERIFGVRYTTIASGDPNAPTRKDRRYAARKQRLRNDGSRRQWW